MDPSAIICLAYDSLKRPPPSSLVPSIWYIHNNQDKLTLSLSSQSTRVNLPPQFADIDKYQLLQRVKDSFDNEGFIEARNEMNPFEYIGRSIFINRAAIKLANIDAVHNITREIFTFDKKQTNEPFTFCDVAAGPGGFTQYLQYRFPNAIGYGMTIRSENLDWSTRFLDMSRFTPFYGPDNTGNLYTNWDPFIQHVLKEQPNGVDLVTGDGGFDLEDTQDKTLLHSQEYLSSRLLLTQILVGLACTKVGGNFVVKVFDTVTSISAHLLFILAQCFKELLIFKPISSRPANAERYVICRDRHEHIHEYYDLLAKAAHAYKSDEYLTTLFAEPLSEAFVAWLRTANNRSIDRQLLAAQNILQYMQGQTPEIPEYNLHKFLTIWNLPDTPINPRNSNIRI